MRSKSLWSPSEGFIQSTNIFDFISFISDDAGFSIDLDLDPESQYRQLYNWSIDQYELC